MSTSISFDEMEQAENEAKVVVPANAADLKLDSPDLPEAMRGKSAKEIADQIDRLHDSIRLSEAGRLAAEAKANSQTPAPVIREAPKEEVMTKEALNELISTDPLAAMAYVADLSARTTAKHFEARLGGVASSAIEAAERGVRDEYKLEFELFGDEIKKFKNDLPDKSVLSTSQGWEDMISYIRGRKGNLEKWVDARQKGNAVVTAASARAAERENVGFDGGSNLRADIEVTATNLDPIQKEIADNLGMSHADYAKWSKVK